MRNHVISLAAVFLALLIGVLLGSGLLSGSLLSGLRDDKRELQGQINELHAQNNALTEKLNRASQFDAVMSEGMVRDSLAGKSVVVFRTPDASDDVVESLKRLVAEAGGGVTGTVELTEQFVEANAAEKLMTVVNSSVLPAGAPISTTALDQGSQAGGLLGIVLQINKDPAAPPIDPAQRDTVLESLRHTGFISYSEGVSAADTALVVTGGALGDDAGNEGPTVARFAAALAPQGWGTVLVGSDGSAAGTAAVSVARADPAMAATVSTVDDANMESGRITAILALRDMLAGGRGAHYGSGPGANALTVAQ